MKIILGVDPGFANFGYAALGIEEYEQGPALCALAAGVFETAKLPQKAHVYASEDNLRRARELAQNFEQLVRGLESDGRCIIAIAAEAMSFVRNAAAMAKVGIAWGVLATIAHSKRIPIIQGSPQAVKKSLCGISSASKEDVQAAVARRIGPCGPHPSADVLLERLPKTKREHPADALACALFALQSDVVLAARRAA